MNNIPNIMQMISQGLPQLKANPMQFIVQKRWNVPQSIANDPDAITNYLLQTRQIQQSQVNSAYQMAQQLGFHR